MLTAYRDLIMRGAEKWKFEFRGEYLAERKRLLGVRREERP